MRTFPTPVLPAARPKGLLDLAVATAYLRFAGVDLSVDAVVVLFVRGWFLDGQGEAAKNDHNTYDDAAAICRVRGGRVVQVWTYNANADPRAEHGTNDDGRGWPTLQPGVWDYRFGYHRSRYLAIKPYTTVTVRRDGSKYDEPNATINGHAGGDSWTWSEGCLTIIHTQYGAQTRSLNRSGSGFIDVLWREAAQTKQGGSQSDGRAVFADAPQRTDERPVKLAVVDEKAYRAAARAAASPSPTRP